MILKVPNLHASPSDESSSREARPAAEGGLQIPMARMGCALSPDQTGAPTPSRAPHKKTTTLVRSRRAGFVRVYVCVSCVSVSVRACMRAPATCVRARSARQCFTPAPSSTLTTAPEAATQKRGEGRRRDGGNLTEAFSLGLCPQGFALPALPRPPPPPLPPSPCPGPHRDTGGRSPKED